MPKFKFGDSAYGAQHLTGVVVETSKEIAERVRGLNPADSPAKKSAPAKKTAKATDK